MMNPIGAHFSIKNGYLGAIKEALGAGADALQIFAKSPASAKFRSVTKEEAREVSKFPKRLKIRNIIIHSSYLINLAADRLSEKSFQIKSVIEDIENATALGADGVVVHFGKKLDLSESIATENFIKNIKLIAEKTRNLKPKIIIENTAGQGTEMGFDLVEFSKVFKEINDERKVGICIDTAHAFGAGYDFSEPKEIKKIITLFKENLGLENISCIHFNDSKKPLGSRVDRHDDIGLGTIGEQGLRTFVRELAEKGGSNIPLIIETPEEQESYKDQIKKVRGWLKNPLHHSLYTLPHA